MPGRIPVSWRPSPLLMPAGVVLAVAVVVTLAARDSRSPFVERGQELSQIAGAVDQVNAEFQRTWDAQQVKPTEPASGLQVLRRLSLALHGTVPSLEEIRLFEADERSDKLDHWTRRMLADPRFNDYFAERLARSLVGNDNGQFVIFRRDRFVRWLSEQISRDVPWDEVVRLMIAQEGLWTDRPAVNFVSHSADDGKLDINKLAGRTARAFLGQRIDCAQCHDHPFANWKQHHFEGLAAFFGQARITITGIEDRVMDDGKPVEYVVQDRKTLKDRAVSPEPPFNPEWLPGEGSRRQKLAAWVTHPDNRRFERAIANRVWGLLFGKPWVDPVDSIPDPDPKQPDLLDILGRDFRQHGRSLKRLVQVIAGSEPFRLSSEPPFSADPRGIELAECHWAQFPLVRLRPEQVIGSMLQSSSAQTVDQNSHLIFRLLRLIRENDFVREYGDLGDSELDERGGTIPQRLLLMNGRLTGDVLDPNLVNATSRLAAFASSDRACVEAAYLMCLTRRPTDAELLHFSRQLKGHRGGERARAVEDLVWSLLNATEFSWNH